MDTCYQIQTSLKPETEQEVKNAAIGLFEAAKGWKIFASKEQKATETKDIVKAIAFANKCASQVVKHRGVTVA